MLGILTLFFPFLLVCSHRIKHHLFPGVCHVYYPQIQPIVESTCKEFGSLTTPILL